MQEVATISCFSWTICGTLAIAFVASWNSGACGSGREPLGQTMLDRVYGLVRSWYPRKSWSKSNSVYYEVKLNSVKPLRLSSTYKRFATHTTMPLLENC
jgi:hypothetical protein